MSQHRPTKRGGGGGGGGAVAQSVERATPGEEVPGLIPAVVARSRLVGSVLPAETEVMVSQLCLMCGTTYNYQTLYLGARPRYSLAVDEDVKKLTKQTKLTRLLSQSFPSASVFQR